jgi:hypothetical protein
MRIALVPILVALLAPAASAQQAYPVAPAEITITAPPSTTESNAIPSVPPPSLTSRPSKADAAQKAAAKDSLPNAQPKPQPDAQATARSITRSNVVPTAPAAANQFCYEQQTFNSETFEYESHQICD